MRSFNSQEILISPKKPFIAYLLYSTTIPRAEEQPVERLQKRGSGLITEYPNI